MTRILFAWEMGANLGHANKITQVARQLQGKMDVTIAARSVIAIRDLDPRLNARLMQAPFMPTRPTRAGEPPGQNYPGALLQEGWDSAKSLIPLMEAWHALFDLVQPDILVAQAAPTALLAARGRGFRKAMLGSGYDAPPRATPMPCFTPDNQDAVILAKAQEADALTQANAALLHYGLPALTAFRDLLDVDRYLLAAYPECDHFPLRAAIEPDHPPYLGQLLSIDSGEEVAWANTGAPRIMAYLRPGTAHCNSGVQGLAALGSGADIILAAPGIAPEQAAQLRARGLQVFDGPVRLDRILPDCDLGMSHGTNGIGAAFIAHGVPQIALPTHREQMLFAQAVATAGLGLGIAGQYGGPQVVEAVRKALNTAKLQARCLAVRDLISANGLDRPARAAADILTDLSPTRSA